MTLLASLAPALRPLFAELAALHGPQARLALSRMRSSTGPDGLLEADILVQREEGCFACVETPSPLERCFRCVWADWFRSGPPVLEGVDCIILTLTREDVDRVPEGSAPGTSPIAAASPGLDSLRAALARADYWKTTGEQEIRLRLKITHSDGEARTFVYRRAGRWGAFEAVVRYSIARMEIALEGWHRSEASAITGYDAEWEVVMPCRTAHRPKRSVPGPQPARAPAGI